ncbi:ead/Ea22-like family protein [Citrobacter freundii]|uniref:ead/Ea22-like family protein n=1 Tax=Citrobacter freundii TaxID=546 RepID=UPI00196886C2|nr:ead/Ea22-like family protein [Citrobacter freundii]QSB88046.1 ead/Ea22-like family protein [Citrobacter freundii]CAE6216746.1 hypothetical protein AI2642V1_1494 [Citrobacter freundii]CAH3420798.1 hypothetical protein AI2642V1_1494 [Citrobacter freundii]HAU4311527.1 hypothetical protein [Citrobacter freundii]HCR3442027.1 ead/Ea22-like family protein [Citrobacter freundii]
MTALNKQALRELATKARTARARLEALTDENVVLFEDDDIKSDVSACNKFIVMANPDSVLTLLNELEAAEKRIDELSASHSKLREGMAAIYNAICENGASTSLSAILTFVKRSREESASAAGIGVKGE